MGKSTATISVKFGMRLGNFKKKANVSFAKMSYGTSISVNHINNTVKGKANPTIMQVEAYARFFGVEDHEMLEFGGKIPGRLTLQRNIKAHFESIGYISNESFKKLGPSYMVEEFIEEYGTFPKPLEAAEIKELSNSKNETSYKTNDVTRVLNKLVREEILVKINTGNPKKPKYDTRK